MPLNDNFFLISSAFLIISVLIKESSSNYAVVNFKIVLKKSSKIIVY